MSLFETHAKFATTSWTLVAALQDEDHPGHDEALEALASRYWPPVYASVRRMGRNRQDAADLTQAFFADVVLGRRLFDHAEAKRGKLRTLLLTALKRFMIDEHRRRKCRPDEGCLSLDALEREERFLAREPEVDPEEAFERRLAMVQLEEALRRCERSLVDGGLDKHWAAFDAFAVKPAIGAVSPPLLAKLAKELGFASAVHVASALKVVRKRIRLLLREVVAETALDPADQEAEYRQVVALLS